MNVFDLYAKISLDTKGYEKDLDGARSSFSKFGDGLKSAAGKVGDVLAGIGKTAAVGIGAAGTALTALTKQTLDAVGSFEQLEGGAQKIFDEMDFEKISNDAKNAYKELNMSAAQYLEAINLAGATFAQTMGDEKGYDTARKGMLAIADYASGTGRNLEELNQKYQMITRATSSYQSIADQFSGILPATSADFLEQAQAAGYLADTYEKLTDVPVAEYQQALTNMLERGVKNLGLSNNTLRESTETLTGSFAMAKAAWQNFLTGQGTVKDFTGALTSAISNTQKKLHEIIPRLTEGLTELIDQLAPELPVLIEDTLPAIITGASTLLTGLASRLPQLLTTILPALSEGVVNVSVALVEVMPQLITSLKESIPIIVRTIMSKKDDLLKAGKDIVRALIPDGTQSIQDIASGAASVVSKFAVAVTDPKNLNKVTDKAFDIISALIDGLLSEKSLDSIFDSENGMGKVITNLIDGIIHFVYRVEDAATEIIIKLGDYLADEENRQKLWDTAKEILKHLGSGLVGMVEHLAPFLVELGRTWAEMFIGDIDYDDTAWEIITRLGKAFVHNMATGGIIGKWIEESAADYANELDEHVESDNSYDVMLTAEGMRKAGVPQAGIDAYIRSQQGYASGFFANQPTVLNNTLVGEQGDEVLLPLDTHTEWMDKLASRINGGARVENLNVTVNVAGAMDESSVKQAVSMMIDEISLQLSDLQGRESRGYGLGFAGGAWA